VRVITRKEDPMSSTPPTLTLPLSQSWERGKKALPEWELGSLFIIYGVPKGHEQLR
jgi:hypothetical protein